LENSGKPYPKVNSNENKKEESNKAEPQAGFLSIPNMKLGIL